MTEPYYIDKKTGKRMPYIVCPRCGKGHAKNFLNGPVPQWKRCEQCVAEIGPEQQRQPHPPRPRRAREAT